IDTAEAEGLVDSGRPSPINHPVLTSPLTTTNTSSSRPPLKRESSAPPPSNPPPAPPTQPSEPNEYPSEQPDSLTLDQLKRIRSTFPNAQQPTPREQLLDYSTVYDFQYKDAQSFPVEVEEWFTYSEEEELRLRKCKAAFNQEWRTSRHGEGTDWTDVTEDARREFMERQVESLRSSGGKSANSLMILVYVALGVWEETAGRASAGRGLADLFPRDDGKGGSRLGEYGRSGLQIQWIVRMVDALHACGGLKVVYEALQAQCEDSFAASPIEVPTRNEAPPKRGEESMQLWCCLTLMYLFVEVARTAHGPSGKALKQDILALEPKLVNYFTQIVARLRWDDVAPIPLTKMLLLAWKTVLVTFGGLTDVEMLRASLKKEDGKGKHEENDDRSHNARRQPIITASPLDYHLFRQEISSKYPAYQPPAPLFPLEPENNSILPPLKHRQPPSHADATSTSAFSTAPSIMHQPVHIATPAPSPPPSPGGPGKAGKKQNYQTNQMFPFLYPPVDGELGGKGSTRLQDEIVGRRWEGGGEEGVVPASIKEAAELFAGRMRATRAMRQLWEVRMEYMRAERGWKGDRDAEGAETKEVDGFQLVEKPSLPAEETLKETWEQKKLKEVEEYYRDSLPHLQSVVIVLLKAVLQNVTDLVTKSNGQNGVGLQAGIHFNDVPIGSAKPVENGNGINHTSAPLEETTADDLDRLRTQEVAAKALSAILLLLLKWFKVTHILMYEYLTQLLLDSNYVPLILKLWQTQEIGRACHFRLDKEECGFWWFCRSNSRRGLPEKVGSQVEGTSLTTFEEMEESEEEDAVPPPIKRSREEEVAEDRQSLSPTGAVAGEDEAYAAVLPHPPEVDELGYPTTPLPDIPIRDYNWRATFTLINHLRTLQKLTRRKTHRALLLVSYKSSNHLKKSLRIPVQQLRYYTLKLFKSQVPFCGRKWRQSNMKIITAVWLSVPAELRDDWLSGGGGGMGGMGGLGDVDGTVEDALPLEQGLRGLTFWWNLRRFPEAMGVQQGVEDKGAGEEMGFFERELEKMDIGAGMGLDGEMEGEGEEEGEGW
ncbi:hypothetical protein BAUCODRAFT_60272, partial [Baudoinia panamericana UAMH 10762]